MLAASGVMANRDGSIPRREAPGRNTHVNLRCEREPKSEIQVVNLVIFQNLAKEESS